jgi:CO/xanthine dehydrogenase Mo-binding subunit
VITPFVGGGFGGKSTNHQAIEAARLAQHTRKPVQVFWSREEEFFYDTFRPAAVVTIRSGLDDSGRLSLWDYNVMFAGRRASEQFYDIQHHRTQVSNSSWVAPPGVHPFATGAWRAPAANTNTFARESQIDIMASMAGVDPLDFRLSHLSDDRMKGVLRAAADRFGWTPGKAPSGRGYGIACGVDADTAVATMAEVDVDEQTGHVQVKRMVCAQDMGLVINPEGASMQIEGCLMMGLGYALSEELHFDGGKIHDVNFGTYQLPQFSWLPEIETVLVDSGDLVPHGGGEPAIITVGAVIANAIFDASGARLFRSPMTPERVLEAVQKSED